MRFNALKCYPVSGGKGGAMAEAQSNRSQNEAIERLCAALCTLESAAEAKALLADLCTAREIDELAQRLEVATLLREGASYLTVSRETGASSTTVSRVSKCLNGEVGGYRLVLDRLA